MQGILGFVVRWQYQETSLWLTGLELAGLFSVFAVRPPGIVLVWGLRTILVACCSKATGPQTLRLSDWASPKPSKKVLYPTISDEFGLRRKEADLFPPRTGMGFMMKFVLSKASCCLKSCASDSLLLSTCYEYLQRLCWPCNCLHCGGGRQYRQCS